MNFWKLVVCLLTLTASFGLSVAQEAPRPAENGWIDFKKPLLPDPILQHSKETYIKYGCAYCHGVDLHVRNGEAADLLHSSLVAGDEDGKIIVTLLRMGIPQTAKLSPMPQFSDLSAAELSDVAQWVHYARMEGHFEELMNVMAEASTGNTTAGQQYYTKTCESCHSTREMKGKLKTVGAHSLKAFVLKPAFVENTPSFALSQSVFDSTSKARTKHIHLLETYRPSDVADLLAYLKTLQ
jgi:mono/diheme cytochrome c family protein